MEATERVLNVVWQCSQVTRKDREILLNQRGCTIWLTGLPSSGKTTTAFALEKELIKRGFLAYVLDGDNVRHGLNRDLGFSRGERQENIRRVAEVARLFADAGFVVITSFISPYRSEREFARTLHEEVGLDFVEVFIDAPLEVCEARDPKGLYKKARQGHLKGMTGIDDPYETPLQPELILKTDEDPPPLLVEQVISFLALNGCLFLDSKLLGRSRETLAQG
jgi:adenylylsulfate kinase